jgi:predicted RNase H-like HicB family nuclease
VKHEYSIAYTISGGVADMRDYAFTVVVERDEDGRYEAIWPALQGCYAEAEAWELIADAIRLHIEHRLEAGEPIAEEIAADRIRSSA